MNSNSQTDPVPTGVSFDPTSDTKAGAHTAAVRVDQLERQITQSNVVWGVWAVIAGVLFAASQLWSMARGPDHEEIQSYSIPKDASLQAAGFVRFQPTPPSASPAVATPARMLGAILPVGSELWFFKLMGPVAQVDAQVESVQQFLKGLQLKGATPSWTLPTGWKERGPSEMRFATLEIPGEAGVLELSVSRLPMIAQTENEALLANVNRWRGQLALPAIDADRLASELQTLASPAGNVYWVNLAGLQSGSGGPMGNGPMSSLKPGIAPSGQTPPFAGTPSPTGTSPASPTVEPDSDVSDSVNIAKIPKFQVPEGWTKGRLNEFRKAAFEVSDGSQKLEITLSDLPRSAGLRLPNINRWRGQVMLPPWDETTLTQELRKLSVGAIQADYVVLVSSDGSGKTMLGAILDHADRTWFIKLLGDSALANREQPRFEEFVQSLKFD